MINYSLVNAGVGPARIASMQLRYEGSFVHNINELIDACCHDAVSTEADPTLTRKDRIGGLYTANPSPIILSSRMTRP